MKAEEVEALRSLPRRPMARVLKPADADAWQDGQAYLKAARQEAEQMREASRRAYAGEYAQGYEDGKADGNAEAARLVNETIIEIDRYLASIEKEVADLAFDVVRRVLGTLDMGELVALAAHHAIADIRRAKYLRISVHPDSLNAVQSKMAALVEENRFGFSIEVEVDRALSDDACIVATDATVIDASIRSQLDTLAAALSKKGG